MLEEDVEITEVGEESIVIDESKGPNPFMRFFSYICRTIFPYEEHMSDEFANEYIGKTVSGEEYWEERWGPYDKL